MTDAQNQHPYMEINPLNLRISPELVGASLEFELNRYRLQFRLPSSSNPKTLAPKDKNDFSYAPSDNGLVVRGWQPQEDELVPREVLVERAVLIFVESPEFEHYRNKVEADTDCNQVANKLKEVGEQATQLWLRTLRWKSDDALNGRVAADHFSDNTGVVYIPPINGRAGCGSAQMLAPHNTYSDNVDEKA